MKLYHITHNDLDGAACAIVARLAMQYLAEKHMNSDEEKARVAGLEAAGLLKPDDPQVSLPSSDLAALLATTVFTDYSPNGGIDEQIRLVFEKHLLRGDGDTPPALLLLSDISPKTPEAYAALDAFFAEESAIPNGRMLHCYDHHQTSKAALASRRWGAHGTSCGAQGVMEFFQREFGWIPGEYVYEFVRAVNAYDLWRLDDSRRARGERLHRLFKFLGTEEFVERFVANVSSDEAEDAVANDGTSVNMLFEIDKLLLRRETRTVNDAVNSVVEEYLSHSIVHTDSRGLKFLVMQTRSPEALIAHAVLEALASLEDADVDYIVMADPVHDRLGFYSMDSSEVDVSEIARALGKGGGGHKHAAGSFFPMRTSLLVPLISALSGGNSEK